MANKVKKVESFKDFSFRGWTEKNDADKKAGVVEQGEKYKIKLDEKAIVEAVAFFNDKYAGKAGKGKGKGKAKNFAAMSYDELKATNFEALLEAKKGEKIESLKAEKVALEAQIKEIDKQIKELSK